LATFTAATTFSAAEAPTNRPSSSSRRKNIDTAQTHDIVSDVSTG
jgi:hypothetical protein